MREMKSLSGYCQIMIYYLDILVLIKVWLELMRKSSGKENNTHKYVHHHGLFVHEPIGRRQGCLGREAWLVPVEQVIFLIWLLKSSSAESGFGVTWDTNIFRFFAHSERALVLPRPPCHGFPSDTPSKSLSIHPTRWLQPVNLYRIARVAISPSKRSEQAGAPLDVLPWLACPPHCSLGSSWKGTVGPCCSLLGDACMLYGNQWTCFLGKEVKRNLV